MNKIQTIINQVLHNTQNIDAMKIASINGIAAVSPLAPMIEGILRPLKIGERNYLKQLIGKKIFKILTKRGFIHDSYGGKVETSPLFTVGSIYKKSNKNSDEDEEK